MGTLLGIILGTGGFWLLSKFQSASASSGDIQSGSVIENTDTDKLYLFGEDGKIHEILDVRALTADQVASKAILVNNAELLQFEEGAPITC